MKFTKFDSHDVVESTMDLARTAVNASGFEACGTVVMAEFQTKGRGRQGRGWFAPPGANVCMTAICDGRQINSAWIVALMAGIASAEAIAEVIGMSVNVRFPNDIYLNGKKLGGILVETAPTRYVGSVIPLVGIGVNVNVAASTFPADIASRATSILAESGQEYAVGAVAGQILLRLGEILESAGTLEEIVLPRWRALSVPENRRKFLLDGEPVLCTVDGINSLGMVELTTDAGEDRMIHAAQVILGDD